MAIEKFKRQYAYKNYNKSKTSDHRHSQPILDKQTKTKACLIEVSGSSAEQRSHRSAASTLSMKCLLFHSAAWLYKYFTHELAAAAGCVSVFLIAENMFRCVQNMYLRCSWQIAWEKRSRYF